MNHRTPIPKAALPEAISVRLKDESSEYDGDYLEPFVIEGVRYEDAEALSSSEFQLAENATGRIWIDAVNSKGAVKVPRGSKVLINGDDVQVIRCAPFKTLNGYLHHWELDVG